MAAIDAFLALPDARRVVLCKISAREALHRWISDGSNTYYAAFDPYTHPTALRADRGLYRELTGVRENTTTLTLVASVAAVKASLGGTYFNDTATSRIYVKTSGLVNPDTVARLQAVFVVRVATEPQNFVGTPPYDAQLDGERLPIVQSDRADLLRGITSFPSGDLSLVNADGFWDYPASAWTWTSATATFLIGGNGLTAGDYVVVAEMQLSRPPAAGDLTCILQLRSRSNATNKAFPPHSLYDFGGPGVVAQGASPSALFPVWWGVVTDAPLVFGGDNGLRNKWYAGDPLLMNGLTITFSAVAAVERSSGTRTALTASVDYFTGFSDTSIDVSKTYPPETHDIIATVSRPVTTCGAVALDILRACGIPDALIDLASFTQADLDNPAPLSLWVGTRPGEDSVIGLTTGTDLLNLIERSTLMAVTLYTAGLWTAKVWDPSFDLASLAIFTDRDLFSCAPVEGVTSGLSTAVKLQYNRAIYGDSWTEVSASSTAAEADQDGANTDAPVQACLAAASDAAVQVARLALIDRLPPLELAIEIGPELMRANVGDKIRIQRARGASRVSGFDQAMELQSCNKRLSTMTLEATVSNQRGLGELVKRVAPGGGANWAGSTADERRAYAFVCDSTTGLVDPADPSTFQQAVAW